MCRCEKNQFETSASAARIWTLDSCLRDFRILILSKESGVVVRGAKGELLKLRVEFREIRVIMAVYGSVDVVRHRASTLVDVTCTEL